MPQEKRSEARIRAGEGTVLIDGKGYPIETWSNGGFSVLSYTGARSSGDEVPIVFSIYLSGSTLEVEGRALIVWTDADRRRLGALITAIDDESRKVIRDRIRSSR